MIGPEREPNLNNLNGLVPPRAISTSLCEIAFVFQKTIAINELVPKRRPFDAGGTTNVWRAA